MGMPRGRSLGAWRRFAQATSSIRSVVYASSEGPRSIADCTTPRTQAGRAQAIPGAKPSFARNLGRWVRLWAQEGCPARSGHRVGVRVCGVCAAETGQGAAQAGVCVVGDLADLGAAAEADHSLGVDRLDDGVLAVGATADHDVAGQQAPRITYSPSPAAASGPSLAAMSVSARMPKPSRSGPAGCVPRPAGRAGGR